MDLDLEHRKSIHPGNKAGKGCLPTPTCTNQDQMALGLSEDTIDAQRVLKHIIE